MNRKTCLQQYRAVNIESIICIDGDTTGDYSGWYRYSITTASSDGNENAIFARRWRTARPATERSSRAGLGRPGYEPAERDLVNSWSIE